MSAAGTLTVLPTSPAGPGKVRKIKLAWTSDASGNVSQAVPSLDGILRRAVFVPGTAAPTDLYDVTLLDEHGVDVLGGAGANQSATVPADSGCPIGSTSMQRGINGPLTLTVANAGDTKSGALWLYLE